MNGLGIGTPASGLTKLAVSGGEFYFTPYTIVLSGANAGHTAEVRAYISLSFSTPSSVLQLMSCPSPGACATYTNYANLPATQAGEVVVLPSTATNGNYTGYLGLFVADNNGIAITNNDSATVTFDTWDTKHNTLSSTIVLNLDTPTETVQRAVQLQLATAASGLTINAGGSTDFTADFGSVNGLGIGPGAGLTVVSGQAPGGIIYGTPYLIQPAFSGFSSANSTKITVYVSTDFAHSTVLTLYDSQSKLTGYGAISKSSGAQTQITGAAINGTAITEYLGLFVSNTNGGGSFRGTDSATLTFTITVQ